MLINSKVEEKTIIETFSVSFNAGIDNVDKVREFVVNFIDKCDYIDTESYEVDKGKLRIDVFQNVSSSFVRFIYGANDGIRNG